MFRLVFGMLFAVLQIGLFAPLAFAAEPAAGSTQKKQHTVKTTTPKAAEKKAAAKKILARKSAARKSAARKSAARKTAARKTAARRTAARKTATKTGAARGRVVKVMRAKRSKHVIVVRRPAPVVSAGVLAGLNLTANPLALTSSAALIIDANNSDVLFERNADVVLPIASLTRLMTAVVVMDAQLNMAEPIIVTSDDIDRLKHSRSRLRVGSRLSRTNMLHIALMSSENRAASALGRNYPGGLSAFVSAMNAKALMLGMTHTRYVEPTGLSSENVSTPNDLAKLVMAAHEYPLIRKYSTHDTYTVAPGGPQLTYRNSNRLIANAKWDIGVQKTGFINEAGRCMVMQAVIGGREVVMVMLDAKGSHARVADAGRMRTWLEDIKLPDMTRMASSGGMSSLPRTMRSRD